MHEQAPQSYTPDQAMQQEQAMMSAYPASYAELHDASFSAEMAAKYQQAKQTGETAVDNTVMATSNGEALNMLEGSKSSKIKHLLGTLALNKNVQYGMEQSGMQSLSTSTEIHNTPSKTSEQTFGFGSQESYRQGEFVMWAPTFAEQVSDTSRINPITYVKGQRDALGTTTEASSLANRKTLSEHDSLVGLQEFLQKAAQLEGHKGRQAASMLENLTFIGKKEYDQATAGIADIWRKELQADPELQICAITGEINPEMVKSDAFLLDNILKNFTDEELDSLQGRLVTKPENLTANPDKVKIILLDDWTISGQQLTGASGNVVQQYPQYKDAISIQLIAASEQRIAQGMPVYGYGGDYGKVQYIPVNAYYAAHGANLKNAQNSGAHITGYHCAVDYDFNYELSGMAHRLQVDMPPASNIVRPYRSGVKLEQRFRLHEREVNHNNYVVPDGLKDDLDKDYTPPPVVVNGQKVTF